MINTDLFPWGKKANMLLLDQDLNLKAVIKDGKMLERQAV